MLLQSLDRHLLDVLEVQLRHCALRVVRVQLHFEDLAVAHM